MSTAWRATSEWKKVPKLASRISAAFERIRAEKRTGLVTYVTAGDPDMTRSADILCALDRAGADVLEVGIPFSEPLADGPVIQRATERALAAGATASGVLDLVARVRPAVKAPIVLFTYANPVLRMGVDAFGDRARAAGVDGVLVLDLPIEEAGTFHDAMASRDIDMIFLLSPTTTDAACERFRAVAADRAGLRDLVPGACPADRHVRGRRSCRERAGRRHCRSGKKP